MPAARPMTRIYLDYNATAPMRPEARAAVLAALETTGNPHPSMPKDAPREKSSRTPEPRSRASPAFRRVA